MIASFFLAAALLDPLGILAHRLPKGLGAPVPGARCGGSMTVLGGVVGAGTTRNSTVVNLWFVRFENHPIGAIAKTYGGTYWYEDLDGGFYEQLTPSNADELKMKGISIGGCFTHAFPI